MSKSSKSRRAFLALSFALSVIPSTGSQLPRSEELRTQAQNLVRKATRADLLEAAAKLQAEIDHGGKNSARDHLALGEIYMKLSWFGQARKAFSQAMTADPEDIDLQYLALSDLADVDSTLGHKEDSLNNSRKALDQTNPGASQRVKARALESQALALLYNPDPAEALDSLQLARGLITREDTEELARYFLYSGFGHLRANETVRALNETSSALDIWEKAGDSYGIARANAALGLLWAALGEPVKARAALNAAMATFKKIGDTEQQAVSLNALGLLSKNGGKHLESYKYFRSARVLFGKLDDPVGEIAAMLGEGGALKSMRRLKAAESVYLEASRRVWKEKSDIQQAVAFMNLGDIYARTGRLPKAEDTLLHALSLVQARNEAITESDVRFHLGALLKDQERYDEAIPFLNEALDLSRTAKRPDKVAQAHFELAGIYRSMARLDSAQGEIEGAIRTIESLRNKHDDWESRAFYFSSVHGYYQLYIDILMDLYRQKGGTYAVRAFEASEKSKVRSLLDIIGQAGAGHDCHSPSSDATPTDARPRDAKQAGGTTPCDARPLSLGDIQEVIRGDNAILLEYARGSDQKHGYLWAVDENGISVEELQNFTELESRAGQVLDFMTARIPRRGETSLDYSARVNRAQKNYPQNAAKLTRALWGHLKNRLAGRRMIIVPDGELPELPYSALVAGLPPASAPAAVVNLPSASLLGFIRKETENRPRPPALAAIFANPIYNLNDPRIHAAGPRRNFSEKPDPVLAKVIRDLDLRLESIAALHNHEAQYISEIFPGQEILSATGFRATRDVVLHTNLTQYRFIHFSVHGLLDTRYPEFSGLLLSLVDEKGRWQDGYLSIPEIYKLHLSADVVVLSACDSALGRDMKSEGIIALPRAFLSAGAKSVLSTLWKVNEDATAMLMKRFYIHLREGRAPDVALQLAQADIRRIPEWSHPYYWAGFILQGDYRRPPD